MQGFNIAVRLGWMTNSGVSGTVGGGKTAREGLGLRIWSTTWRNCTSCGIRMHSLCGRTRSQ